MRFKTKDKHTSVTLKNIYGNIKNEIRLSAMFYCVYTQKISNETICTKLNNQINSMNSSIARINPKFYEKSKNYDKVKEQLTDTLTNYETSLIQFCQSFDKEIEEIILEKVELESKLLMAIMAKEYLYQRDNNEQKLKDRNVIINGVSNVVEKIKTKVREHKQVDMNLINRIQDKQDVEREIKEKNFFSEEYKENQKMIRNLKKELKLINKKIDQLNERKINKTFAAMEAGDKQLSTQIKKPHAIKKITRFFVNRLNTYHVIQKSVIDPINHRIDEFKVNELKKVDFDNKEFDIQEIEQKIKERQNLVLNDFDHKMICKKMEIFSS